MRRSSKPLPKDPNQLAHAIVRLSTEEPEEQPAEKSAISKYLAEIGRKGGLKGGKARAEKNYLLKSVQTLQKKPLKQGGKRNKNNNKYITLFVFLIYIYQAVSAKPL